MKHFFSTRRLLRPALDALAILATACASTTSGTDGFVGLHSDRYT